MHKIVQKWNSIDLILRIVIGLFLGAALGLFVPAHVYVLDLVGKLFVSALKSVAPILVFCLVIGALAKAKSVGNMKLVIVLYAISTFTASLIAVCAAMIFPVDFTFAHVEAASSPSPQGIG